MITKDMVSDKFYDKQLKEITFTEWLSLIKKEKYKVIKKSMVNNTIITTQWVGVHVKTLLTDVSNPPKGTGIFYTAINNNNLDDEGDSKILIHKTLYKSQKEHDKLLATYK